MTETEVKTLTELPKVKVRLVGTDGNAFAVLGTCRKACLKAGWNNAQWSILQAEAMSGDYNHLLATLMKYLDVR